MPKKPRNFKTIHTSRIFCVSLHLSFHLSVSSLTLASFSDNFFAAANSAVPRASCRFNQNIIGKNVVEDDNIDGGDDEIDDGDDMDDRDDGIDNRDHIDDGNDIFEK